MVGKWNMPVLLQSVAMSNVLQALKKLQCSLMRE
jgi:hypothetical protein